MSLIIKIQQAKERYINDYNGVIPDLLILSEDHREEFKSYVRKKNSLISNIEITKYKNRFSYDNMWVYFYKDVNNKVLVAKTWTTEELKAKIRNEVRS